MALNERLDKFKQQQERCQTTLSSIAASQASILRPKVAPGFRPANAPFAPVKQLQRVKFSDDTERLQHINSIRKSTVGAQIKLVIDLLEKVIY
jgi:transcription initiation factor TFIIE subunit beta